MVMLLLTLASGLLYEVYAWRLVPVLVMNGLFSVMVALEIALEWAYDRRCRAEGSA